jgi:branched-chain amino acid transport system substrate-binding protein
MSQQRERFLFGGARSVVAGLLALLLLSGVAAAAEIKIGAVSARTGDNAALGEWQGNGAMMAAEEINAAGGVNGDKLVVVLEDSQGVPAQAVAALNKLIYRDHVVAVIGDSQSSPCLAMLPVIARAQIPMLPHGTNVAITEQKNPWVFRTRANDAIKFGSLANFLLTKMGYKKIAVFHDSADYGLGGAKNLEATLKEKGLKVLADESWTPGDKDFSSQLITIKKLEPEALIIIGPMVDMGLVMKQARQMGIKAQFAGGAGIESVTTQGAAGGAAEELIFAAGFIPANPDPKVQAFVRKYEQLYKQTPNDFAATGYDSIYLLAEAIKKAGSTKPQAIREALRATTYVGVEGTFKFNEVGEGLHDMQFGKVVNGVPTSFTPSAPRK